MNLVFFGGKGGVGKTTISAAYGIRCAKEGLRTIIISSDPAHSLGDVFNTKIGGESPIQLVSDIPLYGLEVDLDREMDEFMPLIREKVTKHLKKVPGVGEEAGDLVEGNFHLPGMDEGAGMFKLLQFAQKIAFDVIIFDTAPTGHTLRFLELPEVLEKIMGRALRIKKSLEKVTKIFSEDKSTDYDDLMEIKLRAEQVKRMLTSKHTHFNLVMIPESMPLEESKDYFKALKELNIQMDNVFINNIIPKHECGCGEFCTLRQGMQKKVLTKTRAYFKGKIPIQKVNMLNEQVYGVEALMRVADQLPVPSHDPRVNVDMKENSLVLKIKFPFALSENMGDDKSLSFKVEGELLVINNFGNTNNINIHKLIKANGMNPDKVNYDINYQSDVNDGLLIIKVVPK